MGNTGLRLSGYTRTYEAFQVCAGVCGGIFPLWCIADRVESAAGGSADAGYGLVMARPVVFVGICAFQPVVDAGGGVVGC